MIEFLLSFRDLLVIFALILTSMLTAWIAICCVQKSKKWSTKTESCVGLVILIILWCIIFLYDGKVGEMPQVVNGNLVDFLTNLLLFIITSKPFKIIVVLFTIDAVYLLIKPVFKRIKT